MDMVSVANPLLKRLVSRELNPVLESLPNKFSRIHSYQIDAISEAVDAFDSGYKLVAIEAPTGSGKTLLGEVIRRMLEVRAVYVCHNKELQAQFAREFDYSRVLYGRANYTPTRKQIIPVTCEDCTWTSDSEICKLCNVRSECPYVRAKMEATKSPVPVLNSAYWLNEVQGAKSRFANTGLAILDEASTLEKVLMDQVEIYVSERMQKSYGIKPPKKVTKQESYLEWAKATGAIIAPIVLRLESRSPLDIREQRQYNRLVTLQGQILGMESDLERELPWVYNGGAGRRSGTSRSNEAIAFKPVKVDRFGQDRIWSKDKRFLLMDATLPDIVMSSLGWTGDYKKINIDSQFLAKNRQVIVRPVANMTRKGMGNDDIRSCVQSVRNVLDEHRGQRVLIHSVSYSLRKLLTDRLRDTGHLYTYEDSSGRSRAIEGYKDDAHGILLAPGLERGIDLPGELCRAQVILKVPFMNLGDSQVQERLYKTPDGSVWYNQHTASTIVQMVGRGVRSDDDWCKAYILDSTFVKWYREWGHLFPKWFRKAIRVEY